MSCVEEREPAVRHRIELPRGAAAAGAARRFLEATHAPHLSDGAQINAQLIVSELVTNAFMHGEGRIVLCVERSGSTLRIEVVDEGTGAAPTIREQPDGGAGGWGLRIVETLALRWGAFEGTTHVWAEIAVD